MSVDTNSPPLPPPPTPSIAPKSAAPTSPSLSLPPEEKAGLEASSSLLDLSLPPAKMDEIGILPIRTWNRLSSFDEWWKDFESFSTREWEEVEPNVPLWWQHAHCSNGLEWPLRVIGPREKVRALSNLTFEGLLEIIRQEEHLGAGGPSGFSLVAKSFRKACYDTGKTVQISNYFVFDVFYQLTRICEHPGGFGFINTLQDMFIFWPRQRNVPGKEQNMAGMCVCIPEEHPYLNVRATLTALNLGDFSRLQKIGYADQTNLFKPRQSRLNKRNEVWASLKNIGFKPVIEEAVKFGFRVDHWFYDSPAPPDSALVPGEPHPTDVSQPRARYIGEILEDHSVPFQALQFDADTPRSPDSENFTIVDQTDQMINSWAIQNLLTSGPDGALAGEQGGIPESQPPKPSKMALEKERKRQQKKRKKMRLQAAREVEPTPGFDAGEETVSESPTAEELLAEGPAVPATPEEPSVEQPIADEPIAGSAIAEATVEEPLPSPGEVDTPATATESMSQHLPAEHDEAKSKRKEKEQRRKERRRAEKAQLEEGKKRVEEEKARKREEQRREAEEQRNKEAEKKLQQDRQRWEEEARRREEAQNRRLLAQAAEEHRRAEELRRGEELRRAEKLRRVSESALSTQPAGPSSQPAQPISSPSKRLSGGNKANIIGDIILDDTQASAPGAPSTVAQAPVPGVAPGEEQPEQGPCAGEEKPAEAAAAAEAGVSKIKQPEVQPLAKAQRPALPARARRKPTPSPPPRGRQAHRRPKGKRAAWKNLADRIADRTRQLVSRDVRRLLADEVPRLIADEVRRTWTGEEQRRARADALVLERLIEESSGGRKEPYNTRDCGRGRSASHPAPAPM
ncbi:hypothetical protein B0T16DRAFT_497156 [Cercophora newfieldiana]|uniref:Uncharacterized protein n=1 Tax=Cercophora newfieldiana TaxID=92897 RepID=A0AA40CJ15_9PEZI|nr:hypothetical protein B0T16DRAFT_497156 [Cercophora newfieldiana]